jgi:hypothetical protein
MKMEVGYALLIVNYIPSQGKISTVEYIIYDIG